MPTAKITALGCYSPPGLLTNADLEKIVVTSDQWIVERTGIKQRHIAPPEMATSDMAVEAAKVVLAQRGIDPPLGGESPEVLVQQPLGVDSAAGEGPAAEVVDEEVMRHGQL